MTVTPLFQQYEVPFRLEMAVVTPKGGAGSCKNHGLAIHHWKPIAVFSKKHKFEHAVNDTVYEGSLSDEVIYNEVSIGNGKPEKEYGLWQQKVHDFEVLISRLTDPDDLVVDLMMGSGTTCVATIKTGRRTIGIEKDWATFEVAKTRWIEKVLVSPAAVACQCRARLHQPLE
jgi:hypothetical protein